MNSLVLELEKLGFYTKSVNYRNAEFNQTLQEHLIEQLVMKVILTETVLID